MHVAGSRTRALLVAAFAVATGLAPVLSMPQAAVVPVRTDPGQMVGQPPGEPKGNGILIGQVVDASTKRGIAGATVSVVSGQAAASQTVLPTGEIIMMTPSAAPAASADAPPRQVLTDSSGRFMFRNLAAGRYSLRAAASPYLTGGFGASRPVGSVQTIELTRDDEKRDGIVIRMWKAAAISGTITDEAGEPVIGISVRSFRRAAVNGRLRLAPGAYATTDDRGVYRMSGLVPGEYFVGVMSTQMTLPVATADSFMQAMYSGGLSSSEVYRDLMSSSVSPGLMMSGGHRVGDFIFQPANSGRGGGSGVVAPPGDEVRLLTYPSVFYPSAAVISQASAITVASGEDRTNVDLHLKLVPGVRVSGVVIGPDGPIKNLGLRLLPAGADDFSTESGIEAATTATDANGAFTFLGVTPGQYTLKSLRIPRNLATGRGSPAGMVEVLGPNGMVVGMMGTPGAAGTPPPPPPLPTDPVLWAMTNVTVADSHVNGVTLTVRPGARLSGRLVFETETDKDKPTPAQIQQAQLSVTAVAGTVVVSGVARRFESDGSFTTLGYPPGRYFVTASVPGASRPLRFKSAMSGGRDVSDVGLDLTGADVSDLVITLTDKSTSISGIANNDRGQPDQGASVIVMPADSTAWKDGIINTRRIRSARVATSGAFSFGDLPPGAYFIAAISNDLLDDWQLPTKLEAISRAATRVVLEDGGRITQTLTTRVIR